MKKIINQKTDETGTTTKFDDGSIRFDPNTEPDCMCKIHRSLRPEEGACLCKDMNCDCYKEREEVSVVHNENQNAFAKMKEAFILLENSKDQSREKSVSMTNLETAIMWLNKHRTMVGEFEPTPTHVQKGGEQNAKE